VDYLGVGIDCEYSGGGDADGSIGQSIRDPISKAGVKGI